MSMDDYFAGRELSVNEIRERISQWHPDERWGAYATRPDECPNRPHRGPEGPCEDISQCGLCLCPTFALRPAGECFGEHAPDCSLLERHESFCKGGGAGHPKAEVLRGWPEFTWPSGGGGGETGD